MKEIETKMQIDFKKTEFLGVAATLDQCPTARYPEIVLAGRSNVGKSSFVNALGQNKTLAKTSSTPGKTKLVIYFLADKSLLIADLPGYGYTKASKEKQRQYADLVDNYFTSGRKIAFVIHFMDIRHPPSAEDLQMKEWMESNGIRYFILLSKADKLSRLQMRKRIEDFRQDLGIPAETPVVAVSSQDRTGMDEAAMIIRKWIETAS